MRYEKLIQKKGCAHSTDSATAQSIIHAARELFLQRGYKAVTMREIAAKAGVNLGLLPYYFSTKDNLANQVYALLTDEMYERMSQQYHLEELSDAVRMYVYTVLTLEKADESFYRFYNEYLEGCHSNEAVSETFHEMSRKVIEAYHMEVTPAENEVYLLAMKGAERLLNIRSNHQEINITPRQILNVILSNYLYNIGLSDREIARVIEESNDTLNRLE